MHTIKKTFTDALDVLRVCTCPFVKVWRDVCPGVHDDIDDDGDDDGDDDK